MSKAILVLNAGSSSIKFELFRLVHGEPEPELSGQMEGIGAAPHLLARDSHRKVLADRRWPGPDVSEHVKALALIMDGIGPAIAEATHRVIRPGGAFLVYQFSPKVRDFLSPHFTRIDHDMEWWNVPPAQLYWCWKD